MARSLPRKRTRASFCRASPPRSPGRGARCGASFPAPVPAGDGAAPLPVSGPADTEAGATAEAGVAGREAGAAGRGAG